MFFFYCLLVYWGPRPSRANIGAVFVFFWGRDDGGSSRHLDDEVGGLNLPGKSKDEGQGIASYLFATSADGKIRNHQLCASQFLHFCGQKTLCHIQEQHGRRWSLAFFFGCKWFREDQDQVLWFPQKDPNSNFLRTAVKAFNRKALDVPETMPRSGLESVEASSNKKAIETTRTLVSWQVQVQHQDHRQTQVEPGIQNLCDSFLVLFLEKGNVHWDLFVSDPQVSTSC